jgi:hypothetical protein
VTESSFNWKLFFEKWSFDRKFIWPKAFSEKWTFDRKVIWPNAIFEKWSFDRKSFWQKVKQPWFIIRIGKLFSFLNLHPTIIEFDCPIVKKNIRSNDCFSKKAFGQMHFRSNEFLVKRPCANLFFLAKWHFLSKVGSI